MKNNSVFYIAGKIMQSFFKRDRHIKEAVRNLKKNIQYYLSTIFCYPFVTPENATIHLTYQCNLMCPICEIINVPLRDKLSQPQYNLTTIELESAIKQIKQMNISEIMLTGGEPFLRKDLLDIVKLCVKYGVQADVTTNGTLIDERIAKDISSSGIRHIQVSIDSDDHSTNDFIRGRPGSLLKALEGINNISKHKAAIGKTKYDRPTLGINTVIVAKNIDHLVSMANFFKKIDVIQIVYLPFVSDTSNLQHVDNESSFWPAGERLQQLDAVIDELVKLKQEDSAFINPHQPIEYLLLLKKYYRHEIKVTQFRCLSALNRVVSGPNGDIAYCGGSFGNLRKNSLSEIWYSDKAAEARKKVRRCKNPCLQVCMGKTECENLRSIFSGFIKYVARMD